MARPIYGIEFYLKIQHKLQRNDKKVHRSGDNGTVKLVLGSDRDPPPNKGGENANVKCGSKFCQYAGI
jgi:hypothetical protein